MELRTQDFEIFPVGDGSVEHKVLCYDKNLCRRLNLVLKHYPEDYTFKEGDEAIFRFPTSKMLSVKTALKIKS